MQESSSTPTGTIIQLSGQISSATIAELQQQLVEALAATACSSLSLDMSQVEALDSAGLMLLVSTLTLAQRLNKQFSLFGVSPSVRIIFELTQLDRVFNILEKLPQPLSQAAAA
ncbi:MAG: STAS domain-containing protein [Pegethrix bostrychoides GSE-TBD4-15B]|jgi:anti-anti-sigma factor|uniref:Anti-sigma factor antagonist n=1 Tax=Pegethrix bostrychoides GSE-TBD4-15B TaxID=2839662 RepID=A0A951PGI2_9CYAN|nr:STAS domain-containing protein [Pegethrix bostrychoides GSE-TBD4-15B]